VETFLAPPQLPVDHEIGWRRNRARAAQVPENPAGDRIIHFTNLGVIVCTDPLKPRLDLWQLVCRGSQ
jgi:hypothetical protein